MTKTVTRSDCLRTIEVGGVEHRLRWIPPGRFLMGSPKTEVGRWDDEGPVHEVELSAGYWLGETPVTQALWEAVMGENPSRFQAATRPVEQVSFADCQVFLGRLNQLVPGLGARLPTEAEWEWACRAGTQTATWLGDLRPGEEHARAAVLERIAWYDETSGGETHPVRQKEPRPAVARPTRWGRRSRTRSGSTICWATSGSGVRTGMVPTTRRTSRRAGGG